LAYETGIPNTIDPLAGSYYVEALTDRLERQAEAIFEEVERVGGVVRGIEMGYFQREIARSAERQQREIDSGERVVVGVNAFTQGGTAEDLEILKIDATGEERQAARLRDLRQRRDNARARATLDRLQRAARDGGNV